MNFTKWTAGTLTALMLASAPAFADDKDKNHDEHSFEARYMYEVAPGHTMLFKNPVSFTGEVVETSNSHRTLKAANGMTLMVPNQALVWNGDTKMFSQNAQIGDEVVLHLRSDEPYRIMSAPTPAQFEPMMAIGSYEGVFYLSEEFVADLDLDDLDSNIYADYDTKNAERSYDIDLASVSDDDDDLATLENSIFVETNSNIDNDGDMYDDNDPDEVFED